MINLVEGLVAGLAGAEQMLKAFDALHFLDVDAGVEAFAFGGEDDDPYIFIFLEFTKGVPDLPRVSDGDRVHRRVVHHHFGDVIFDRAANAHQRVSLPSYG